MVANCFVVGDPDVGMIACKFEFVFPPPSFQLSDEFKLLIAASFLGISALSEMNDAYIMEYF